jgi:hypothetical protein
VLGSLPAFLSPAEFSGAGATAHHQRITLALFLIERGFTSEASPRLASNVLTRNEEAERLIREDDINLSVHAFDKNIMSLSATKYLTLLELYGVSERLITTIGLQQVEQSLGCPKADHMRQGYLFFNDGRQPAAKKL